MGAAKKEEMYCSEVGVAAAAAKERETALYNTLPCTLPSKQDIKRKGGIIKDERDERESVGRKIGAWSHLRPAIGRKRKERGRAFVAPPNPPPASINREREFCLIAGVFHFLGARVAMQGTKSRSIVISL